MFDDIDHDSMYLIVDFYPKIGRTCNKWHFAIPMDDDRSHKNELVRNAML